MKISAVSLWQHVPLNNPSNVFPKKNAGDDELPSPALGCLIG
jgi:hypothetical protein